MECTNAKLMTSVKDDHRAVCANYKYGDSRRGARYWKLNSTVLKKDEYQHGKKKVLNETKTLYGNIQSKRLWWEIIKIRIKEFSV